MQTIRPKLEIKLDLDRLAIARGLARVRDALRPLAPSETERSAPTDNDATDRVDHDGEAPS